ncbi:putative membrane protein [Mycolicibacterium novocastrense]|nr:putative membrane protein [Mycolicibacterium novocastrense]
MYPRLPLLSRMARDVCQGGSMRRSTALYMWSAYGAHAAVNGWALACPDRRLPVPRKVSSIGWVAVIGGIGLCIAGMSRFANLGEVEGTRNDALITGGVYRYSRNPQYLGYIMALGGAAVARHSLTSAALAVGWAGVCAAWIPIEEQQLTALYGQAYGDYAGQVGRWWRRPS